ncbi:hypothetical protein K9O30_15045 [Clostridium bowmanii]|uniref:tyrosine-type recombinase/integrase n=1 Tax=Clostridium bowmanii TaxID=132925 RepID=UPI001C0BC5A5|nr:tyrosine-type recombinase/integrase [Clostridium bowmanii]MBU3190740.1 hypothetical protein [Clostridium bowmanii]MCA1075014.1 hypothetical protein [Clostridium bowmanii]
MSRYNKENITKIIETAKTIPDNILTILSVLRDSDIRLNEALSLDKGCMKDSEETYYLYYQSRKDLKLNGLKTNSKDIVVNISRETFELLTKQKNETDKMYPLNKYLFGTDDNKNYSNIKFMIDIKKLLKSNNMEDIQISNMRNHLVNSGSCQSECTHEIPEDCILCKNYIIDTDKLPI